MKATKRTGHTAVKSFIMELQLADMVCIHRRGRSDELVAPSPVRSSFSTQPAEVDPQKCRVLLNALKHAVGQMTPAEVVESVVIGSSDPLIAVKSRSSGKIRIEVVLLKKAMREARTARCHDLVDAMAGSDVDLLRTMFINEERAELGLPAFTG